MKKVFDFRWVSKFSLADIPQQNVAYFLMKLIIFICSLELGVCKTVNELPVYSHGIAFLLHTVMVHG